MSDKLRFALFGNEYLSQKSASVQEVLRCLAAHGAEVSMDGEGSELHADYAISLGGDGTFLRTAARVGALGIPIIGINAGRLGFLADVMPADIETAIDDICRQNILIKEHVAIQMTAYDADGKPVLQDLCALNDIALLKRDNASMISIHTHIDGKLLTTYQADGLVVATPTGSTAYNLSNGGPIMVPGTGILCLTAVAPHSLNIRPIVINDESEIELRVESRSHHYLVAVDGRSENLPESTVVRIRKAPYKVKVVRRRTNNYFDTLRNKLMWGADVRE